MSQKGPFTTEEHQAVEAELRQMSARLMSLTSEIGNRYGVSVKLFSRTMKTYSEVDLLRLEMEAQRKQDSSGPP